MAENKKLITADNSFLTYMGRIDFSENTPRVLLRRLKCKNDFHRHKRIRRDKKP